MTDLVVTNPLNGARLYSLPVATPDQARAAMEQARAAADSLAATALEERLAAVRALVNYLQANRERLLDRIVEESGRCRGDAMISDLFQLTEDLNWLIDNAPKVLADERLPTPVTLLGKTSSIQYHPHGVVLVISPWNLPLAIGLTAAMFAFAAGNAVVLKPSEHTPMADVLADIVALHPLFRDGLRVVQGDGATGAALIGEGPDHIVFTGSLKTGRAILAQAAPMMIPVTLELGARDMMLVFADADTERALNAACWGNLHNSGQSCTATEQLLVEEAVFEGFVAELAERFDGIRTGVGADAELGVPTTDFQMRHIQTLVDDAVERGARVRCGGGPDGSGRFFRPTLLTDVPEGARILGEEIFGPVLVAAPFRDEGQAVARHNARRGGLSTSVFTRDRARGRRLARRLKTGCININNVMLTEGNPALPFGGTGLSGYGRMKGAEGLRGMTRSRAVLEDGSRAPAEPNWYPYSAEKLGLMGRLLDALVSHGLARWWRLARTGLAIERLLRRQRP